MNRLYAREYTNHPWTYNWHWHPVPNKPPQPQHSTPPQHILNITLYLWGRYWLMTTWQYQKPWQSGNHYLYTLPAAIVNSVKYGDSEISNDSKITLKTVANRAPWLYEITSSSADQQGTEDVLKLVGDPFLRSDGLKLGTLSLSVNVNVAVIYLAHCSVLNHVR